MIFTLTPVIPLSALLHCHFNSTTVVEVEERGWKQSDRWCAGGKECGVVPVLGRTVSSTCDGSSSLLVPSILSRILRVWKMVSSSWLS